MRVADLLVKTLLGDLNVLGSNCRQESNFLGSEINSSDQSRSLHPLCDDDYKLALTGC